MVNVRYYINVVERGKLIAFCKVFQHHSSPFPIISPYPTTFNIILPHSPTFFHIPYNPTTFSLIHHISTTSYNISYNPTTSYNIRQHLLYFDIILPFSPTFDKSTSFFYNIFRQHFFSTSFDNILQNLFSTKIFCHLLSNKKLVVCCIINMLLSLSYYQFNIINLILSLSYYQSDIIILIITKLFSIDIHL